jgi:ectoine hydroxylase-related dioxygenase (phytanoyl-CoA dioxygenase family)
MPRCIHLRSTVVSWSIEVTETIDTMHTVADVNVTDSDVAAFRADGAVVLRSVFTDWVETLRAGIERNIAAPGVDVRIYAGGGKGRHFGDYCNWDRIPEYRRFIFESPAARVAARLMSSKTVRLFHEHVLVKEPDSDVPTPWHHDQPYYNVDGMQTCSLWIPLDHVPRDTAVEFVAGSHRWGKWFRPERFNKAPLNQDDGLEPVPDIDGQREQYRILGWAMAPGDAVAFSYLTLHGAPANRQPTNRRRAFSLRLVGDDARWAVRKGVTSPPFRTVTLAHGAVMDAPEFPVLPV